MSEGGPERTDPVPPVLDELDRIDNSHDPIVAIFDGHEARPVVGKYGEGYRMLSSWVVYARKTTVGEFRETWDEHGEPRTVPLSTQSHRFKASDFAEVVDLE